MTGAGATPEASSASPSADSPPKRLRAWRVPAKWLLGALLAANVGLLLVTLSLASATQEGPAKRTLRHSAAILFEIDAYLEDHVEELRQDAQEAGAGEILLPDLPIRIALTADQIEAEREVLRATILDRAADALHDDGVAALEEESTDIAFLSTEGALRSGMDFFRSTPNRVLTALTIAFATAAGLFALGVVATGRGYGRLVALGLAILSVAGPYLIGAVALRFAFRVGADGADEYMSREFLELGGELSWSLIRNGMIFTVGSATVLVAGIGLSQWSDRLQRS